MVAVGFLYISSLSFGKYRVERDSSRFVFGVVAALASVSSFSPGEGLGGFLRFPLSTLGSPQVLGPSAQPHRGTSTHRKGAQATSGGSGVFSIPSKHSRTCTSEHACGYTRQSEGEAIPPQVDRHDGGPHAAKGHIVAPCVLNMVIQMPTHAVLYERFHGQQSVLP